MKSVKNKVLFFIAGTVATSAELAAAEKLENKTTRVVLRNASAIGEGDAVETAQGFAGCVPLLYRTACPEVPIYNEEVASESPAPVVVATSEAPAVVSNPPDFVAPAAQASAETAQDPTAAQRKAEDDGARKATASQLKAALVQLGIEFKSNANKSELLALFLNR